PNVTASWNTVQLLGVPQEGKGQADLLRRLKVFGRKQSLPSSGVPVRAAGTRSRYKVGIYPDQACAEIHSDLHGCRKARVAWSISQADLHGRLTLDSQRGALLLAVNCQPSTNTCVSARRAISPWRQVNPSRPQHPGRKGPDPADRGGGLPSERV